MGFDTTAVYNNLVSLSQRVKPCVDNGTYKTINDALRAMIYKPLGLTNLCTFEEWKEKGFAVKSGSKALPLWAQKAPEEIEEGKSKYKIGFYFSDSQVVKREKALNP